VVGQDDERIEVAFAEPGQVGGRRAKHAYSESAPGQTSGKGQPGAVLLPSLIADCTSNGSPDSTLPE
jgi:hypothetical protein